MAGDVYSKTHKRISELNTFSEPEGIDPIYSLMTPSGASRWAIPIDSETSSVDNTVRIPGDRIAFLTQDGKVLAKNLPSSLSYTDEVVDYNPAVIPGDIDKVYKEVVGDRVTFYRWVQDEPYDSSEPSNPHGEYVPIANKLKVVDGEGTLVEDIPGSSSAIPERRINLNIGSPADDQGSDVLFIGSSDHKLKHATSGVQANTYPVSQSGTPGFGGVFKIPTVTVNDSGHLPVAYSVDITMPSTVANGSTPGLVRVSDATPRPIGTKSAGTANGLVSSANHVHTSSTLTFSNIPNAGIYALYQGLTLDFDKILQATLPGTPTDGMILGANVSGNTESSAWKTPTDTFSNETVTLTSDLDMRPISTSGAQVWNFTGLNTNCLYAVDLQFDIVITASPGAGSSGPLPDMRPVTVTVGGIGNMSVTVGGIGNMSRTFNVDASRYYYVQNEHDFPMHVSLSGMIHTDSSTTTASVTISFDNPIFSVKLNRGVATLLYRNVPAGN